MTNLFNFGGKKKKDIIRVINQVKRMLMCNVKLNVYLMMVSRYSLSTFVPYTFIHKIMFFKCFVNTDQ